jgi:hypothetical protein
VQTAAKKAKLIKFRKGLRIEKFKSKDQFPNYLGHRLYHHLYRFCIESIEALPYITELTLTNVETLSCRFAALTMVYVKQFSLKLKQSRYGQGD